MTNAFLYVLTAAALIPAFLIAIPVHEMGHAFVAYLLGDRSVRYFGYFTWNPRRFLDLFGVIAVFLALVGWGRPVPIQSTKIDTTWKKVLVKLGGPAANLVLAIVLGRLQWVLPVTSGLSVEFVAGFILHAIVFLNLSLFAFQLLPVPGLDGWDIVELIFRPYNPRFFFNVSSRQRDVVVGAFIIIVVGSLFGIRVLNVVMMPFYEPASLVAQGVCAGYGTGYNASLWPCLP